MAGLASLWHSVLNSYSIPVLNNQPSQGSEHLEYTSGHPTHRTTVLESRSSGCAAPSSKSELPNWTEHNGLLKFVLAPQWLPWKSLERKESLSVSIYQAPSRLIIWIAGAGPETKDRAIAKIGLKESALVLRDKPRNRTCKKVNMIHICGSTMEMTTKYWNIPSKFWNIASRKHQ